MLTAKQETTRDAVVSAAVEYVRSMNKMSDFSVTEAENNFLNLVKTVEAYEIVAPPGTGTPTPCVSITPDD